MPATQRACKVNSVVVSLSTPVVFQFCTHRYPRRKGEHSMSQENVTLAQGLYDAGVHRGVQAVAEEIIAPVPTYYEEFAVVPQEFVDAGDRVFVLGEFRGKGKASETLFVAPFVHIFTLRNGKVTHFRNYTDTGLWAQQ